MALSSQQFDDIRRLSTQLVDAQARLRNEDFDEKVGPVAARALETVDIPPERQAFALAAIALRLTVGGTALQAHEEACAVLVSRAVEQGTWTVPD